MKLFITALNKKPNTLYKQVLGMIIIGSSLALEIYLIFLCCNELKIHMKLESWEEYIEYKSAVPFIKHLLYPQYSSRCFIDITFTFRATPCNKHGYSHFKKTHQLRSRWKNRRTWSSHPGSYENCTDESICKAGIEMQT